MGRGASICIIIVRLHIILFIKVHDTKFFTIFNTFLCFKFQISNLSHLVRGFWIIYFYEFLKDVVVNFLLLFSSLLSVPWNFCPVTDSEAVHSASLQPRYWSVRIGLSAQSVNLTSAYFVLRFFTAFNVASLCVWPQVAKVISLALEKVARTCAVCSSIL